MAARKKKFTILVSAAEQAMMKELAADDGRSVASWLRQQIKQAHTKRTQRSTKT